ncbi:MULTISPECIES: hypothetical protein [Halomonas]|uniref:Uncharacterized protein n=1 Tax=Halomonas chromatireducens TaxID=507626 RepID=A0A0X8HAY0_9GAMM|nr:MULTISPECIES: hypothetical protein [Halomonas]AMC99293.1 hypothetical protein LOKO_00196 [Halomonas chromatireducens]MBZ0331190.1 hypothetical protein [Halomonas sp. ANAO-440]
MKQWGAMVLSTILAGGFWSVSAMAERLEGELDGTEREWFILSQYDDASATFTDIGDGDYLIDIVGFADPDGRRSRDSLSISMALKDGEVLNYDVLNLIGTSAMPPVYTSEGGDVQFTLATFAVEGAVARVAGSVQGTLALQEALGEPPNLEEGVDIAVTFDITASRIEY